MAEKRKYRIKQPEMILQVAEGDEETVQRRIEEVFDFIFSKVELEHLQSLSYNDKRLENENE